MSFVRTSAVNKLLSLRKRVKVIPGGTSAGKTYGILPILIDRCCKKERLVVSVVSESIPHLRRGAIKDFTNIMKDTGRWVEGRFNKTNLVYTFGNGSYIEFFSTDQPDRLRGARRDILFINECNNVDWESYQQLAIRTSLEIWLDFNPSNEFWAHTELPPDEDVEWMTLTYKDNEQLQESIIKEIEKAKYKAFFDVNANELFATNNVKSGYWSNWWKVYGLGQLGVLQGTVFTNWSQIDDLPEKAKYMGAGIDFGYTNDPTAIIDVYMYNGQVILDERTYMPGLKNNDIANILKAQGKTIHTAICCDSSEPKSKDEINAYGFNAIGVDKGPDSVMYGISLMQQEHFYVTKRSVNLIKELRKYCWDTDKTGKSLNKPIDSFNHAIDAVRYFFMMYIAERKQIDTAPIQEALKKALQYFS